MGRREYLAAQRARVREKQAPGKQVYYSNPATAMVEPFRIADGLYYVGDKKVCVHLIDTGEGLILLDAGYPCAVHLLVESIWRAGFDPRDVRWILHSHGHFDHFGASEEFRTMYGTKLAIARAEAESLRKYPHRAHLYVSSRPYAKIPVFDRELEDGEVFTMGRTRIRCVLTPGHSVGVMSFFFEVTDNSDSYAVVCKDKCSRLGINVRIEYMDSGSVKAYYQDNSNPYDMIYLTCSVGEFVPNALSINFRTNFWGNDHAQELFLATAASTYGSEESLAAWDELSTLAVEECPWVVIGYGSTCWGLVKGLDVNCQGSTIYWYNAFWETV